MTPMLSNFTLMNPMNPFNLIAKLRRVAAILLLALPLASGAADQQTFATPDAAVNALVAALKTNDAAALVALVGEKHKDLVVTGDQAADAARNAETAALITSFRALEARGNDRGVLLIGPQAWPLPIPLVREGAVWRFASELGREELLNRRIGGNERSAIEVLSAYFPAQRAYASTDRNGDGVLEYALKLASATGKYDGLYWPADAAKGEEISPFGPLIAESSAYLAGHKQGDPYRGYHSKILTRQGKAAAGGAYNYIINGRMIAGFAMLAYPDSYNKSGVMTFIVNHNGKIYQKDLGANTADAAAKISAFNPGAGWQEVVTP